MGVMEAYNGVAATASRVSNGAYNGAVFLGSHVRVSVSLCYATCAEVGGKGGHFLLSHGGAGYGALRVSGLDRG